MDLNDFVLAHLPSGARVLEVGCGQGKLALALAAAGHEVTAIDPEAPAGRIFRRVRLEDFETSGRFDAAVASRSLHHVNDLSVGLDKLCRLLRPRGRLILEEFAWDRLDEATAAWYYGHLRAPAPSVEQGAHSSLEECRRDWAEEHADLHGYAAMRRELDRRFDERVFCWRPYLHRCLEGAVDEALEQALIDRGAVQALGFRYVGELRRFPKPESGYTGKT